MLTQVPWAALILGSAESPAGRCRSVITERDAAREMMFQSVRTKLLPGFFLYSLLVLKQLNTQDTAHCCFSACYNPWSPFCGSDEEYTEEKGFCDGKGKTVPRFDPQSWRQQEATGSFLITRCMSWSVQRSYYQLCLSPRGTVAIPSALLPKALYSLQDAMITATGISFLWILSAYQVPSFDLSSFFCVHMIHWTGAFSIDLSFWTYPLKATKVAFLLHLYYARCMFEPVRIDFISHKTRAAAHWDTTVRYLDVLLSPLSTHLKRSRHMAAYSLHHLLMRWFPR